MAPSLVPWTPLMSRLLLFFLLAVSTIASAGIELLPGSSPQSPPFGTTFPNPVRIRVFDDATGAPVPGAEVFWSNPAPAISISSNNCNPDLGGQCSARTDGSGVLSLVASGVFVGERSVRFSTFAYGAGASVAVDLT